MIGLHWRSRPSARSSPGVKDDDNSRDEAAKRFDMQLLVDYCCVTGMCRICLEVSILKATLFTAALSSDQRFLLLIPVESTGNKTRERREQDFDMN